MAEALPLFVLVFLVGVALLYVGLRLWRRRPDPN